MERPDLDLLPALDVLLQTASVTSAARMLGLSPPAVSHALARLRRQLGDPLLVRAGRRMVLTPRAEALRERVRSVREEASALLSVPVAFDPGRLERAFVVNASDNVLAVVGRTLDGLVRHCRGVTLRFRPNSVDDAEELRDGRSDLAIGIYGDLPPELRTRPLYSDRFVCAVRRGHPGVDRRLTLARFLELEHVQVAPRGRPGGQLDAMLSELGLERRVTWAVPFFLSALLLVSQTDAVVTLPSLAARALAGPLDLVLLEPPLELKPYTLSLVWHPRMDGDEAHRWLRENVLRAAGENAPRSLPGSRTRLDRGEGRAGARRRRKGGRHGR